MEAKHIRSLIKKLMENPRTLCFLAEMADDDIVDEISELERLSEIGINAEKYFNTTPLASNCRDLVLLHSKQLTEFSKDK